MAYTAANSKQHSGCIAYAQTLAWTLLCRQTILTVGFKITEHMKSKRPSFPYVCPPYPAVGFDEVWGAGWRENIFNETLFCSSSL